MVSVQPGGEAHQLAPILPEAARGKAPVVLACTASGIRSAHGLRWCWRGDGSAVPADRMLQRHGQVEAVRRQPREHLPHGISQGRDPGWVQYSNLGGQISAEFRISVEERRAWPVCAGCTAAAFVSRIPWRVEAPPGGWRSSRHCMAPGGRVVVAAQPEVGHEHHPTARVTRSRTPARARPLHPRTAQPDTATERREVRASKAESADGASSAAGRGSAWDSAAFGTPTLFSLYSAVDGGAPRPRARRRRSDADGRDPYLAQER